MQGQARVLKCLDYHSESLTKECTLALFDHKTRMSESLAFNKPLRTACGSEVQRYCARVPTGANANNGKGSHHIQCLQEHRSRKSFGKKCKEVRTQRLRTLHTEPHSALWSSATVYEARVTRVFTIAGTAQPRGWTANRSAFERALVQYVCTGCDVSVGHGCLYACATGLGSWCGRYHAAVPHCREGPDSRR